MNKKSINLSFYSLFFLLMFVLVQSTTVQANDVSSPVLNSLSVDKTTVVVSQDITIFANITDDSSGVQYAEANIYGPLGLYRGYSSLSLNASIGLYQGTFTFTNQFWPTGYYYIDYVYTNDFAGNTAYYYNGTDFSSPKIFLTGTTPDFNSPILNNIIFDKTSVTVNESINIYADITDDLSGVQYAEANIYGPLGQYRGYVSLNYNITFGFYEGSFTFTNQYWPSGNYYVDYVYTNDYADNYGYFYNGSDFFSPIVNFIGSTPDSNPPKFNGLFVDRTSVRLFETVTIFANLTDDISGVQYAEANIYGPLNQYRGYSSLWLNSSSGLYQGNFDFTNQNWPTGEYYIDYLYVSDHADNIAYFYNGSDFLSPKIMFNSTINPPPQEFNFMTNIVHNGNYTGYLNVDFSTDIQTNVTVFLDGLIIGIQPYTSSGSFSIDTEYHNVGYHTIAFEVIDSFNSTNRFTLVFNVYFYQNIPSSDINSSDSTTFTSTSSEPDNSTQSKDSTDSISRIVITTTPGFEYALIFVSLIGIIVYRVKNSRNT